MDLKFKTPYIKITWEDTPENFTKEKIKRVKSYFQEKYNTKYITVVTKSIISNSDLKLQSLEASDQILDLNFQQKLMKDFIKENKFEVKWEMIERLDKKVNEEVSKLNENKVKYNRWYIKDVEFSNFLSFGENNKISYTEFDGITVIESFPKNFGGKTTVSVDLFMFLFFATTTKTKTNAEIFNRYSDKNTVTVKGTIVIDNEDYVIERVLTRKPTKSGDYTVTNKLEFFKVDGNGTLVNLNGEQRRETEKFIESAIGTEEDFLTTIMTTGNNLEQLIESKPTARGQILTKFLGLETLKIKEDECKKIHSDWSKKLLSNNFNQTTLENDNVTFKDSIELSESEIVILTDKINLLETELIKLEEERDELYSKKNNDIDVELINTNVDSLNIEINKLNNKIDELTKTIDSIVVTEPTEYYKEDEHDDLKDKINNIVTQGKLNVNNIENNKKSIKQLEEGESCPTCKQSLEGVDNSEKISSLNQSNESLIKENEDLRVELIELNRKEKEFKGIKAIYDEYEKNKINKTKYELTQSNLKIEKLEYENKLEKYESNKNKWEENKVIDGRLTILKSKIESLKGETTLSKNNVERHKNNITNNKEKIKTNEELIKKIKDEQVLAHVFKIYLTIFGKNGISKIIMKNMIPLLNQELAILLNDSSTFMLELNINDKNEVDFNMIDTETRISKPLNSGSGYEKTISSLALRSVLTKISSLPKPNVVVMDEVFGKIADENLEMVGEFFKKIKNYFEHIILISHNPLIRNWSDNLIMVRKDENISSVEYIKQKI